jgi:hypothetical protein
MGAMVFVLLVTTIPLGLGAVAEPAPASDTVPPVRLLENVGFILREKLLLRVIASNSAVRLGQGIRTALFVFFVSHYMGSPKLAPALFLYQYLFGILACPLWLAIGRRIGKGRGGRGRTVANGDQRLAAAGGARELAPADGADHRTGAGARIRQPDAALDHRRRCRRPSP